MNKKDSPTLHEGIVLWGSCNVFYVVSTFDYEKCVHVGLSNDIVMGFAVECRIKGKRQNYSAKEKENAIFIAGDIVLYTINDTDHSHKMGLIVSRKARTNQVVRQKGDKAHLMAVNLEMIGIILSVDKPVFRPRFADRLAWIAFEQDIPFFIVINKMDMFSQWDAQKQSEMKKYIQQRIDAFENIGIKVICTSMKENAYGVEDITRMCLGKRCALLGQSGSGKSTIINELIPHAEQDVKAISEKYNRGRHTTVLSQTIFGNGYAIVDTPGIRELYPAHINLQSIIIGYPDMSQFMHQCKIPNCTHRTEPMCNVREHIGKEIHPDRYESYLNLLEDCIEKEKNKWYHKKR